MRWRQQARHPAATACGGGAVRHSSSCCQGRGTIVHQSCGNVRWQSYDHGHRDVCTEYRDATSNCCHGTGAAADRAPGAKADRFDNRYQVDVTH